MAPTALPTSGVRSCRSHLSAFELFDVGASHLRPGADRAARQLPVIFSEPGVSKTRPAPGKNLGRISLNGLKASSQGGRFSTKGPGFLSRWVQASTIGLSEKKLASGRIEPPEDGAFSSNEESIPWHPILSRNRSQDAGDRSNRENGGGSAAFSLSSTLRPQKAVSESCS